MREDLVMGRFRIRERLGSGGMGIVYKAFDERLEREVAVKEVSGEPARVLREAQAAARLNHPGIVTLYELGEHDGRAVLVSELVHGETLAELRARGCLSDHDVGRIGCDVGDALAHAHARGVVHRDIKPANLIVREDAAAPERAKLMDFGIARVAGAPALTEVGEVVGTLAYMSPEQAEGAPAGPASDVYSLALTLYECLAGVNPVAGASPAETARRIGSALPRLRSLRPDLPAGVCETLDAALDPDCKLRPSADELVSGLRRGLPELYSDRLVPLPPGVTARRGGRLRLARIGGLVAALALLALLAGPLGAGGLALVLAVLLAPIVAIGVPSAALLLGLIPGLVAIGAGAATPILAAFGPTLLARAVLGAGTWIWLVAASLALGAGPSIGFGEDAATGWISDPHVAADSVLGPLLSANGLVGALVFAAAAVALGFTLGARHLPIALLGTLLWAAGLDAALGLLGDGALAGKPVLLAAAAATAVVIEFTVGRAEPAADRVEPAEPAPGSGRERLAI